MIGGEALAGGKARWEKKATNLPRRSVSHSPLFKVPSTHSQILSVVTQVQSTECGRKVVFDCIVAAPLPCGSLPCRAVGLTTRATRGRGQGGIGPSRWGVRTFGKCPFGGHECVEGRSSMNQRVISGHALPPWSTEDHEDRSVLAHQCGMTDRQRLIVSGQCHGPRGAKFTHLHRKWRGRTGRGLRLQMMCISLLCS